MTLCIDASSLANAGTAQGGLAVWRAHDPITFLETGSHLKSIYGVFTATGKMLQGQ